MVDAEVDALARIAPGDPQAVPLSDLERRVGRQAAMVVLSVPDAATGKRDVSVLEPMFGGGGATRRRDGPAGRCS